MEPYSKVPEQERHSDIPTISHSIAPIADIREISTPDMSDILRSSMSIAGLDYLFRPAGGCQTQDRRTDLEPLRPPNTCGTGSEDMAGYGYHDGRSNEY